MPSEGAIAFSLAVRAWSAQILEKTRFLQYLLSGSGDVIAVEADGLPSVRLVA